MLLRSPHTCSCSTAAARNVSPAASITDLPSFWNCLANLPIVVVLPTPFTPTIKITNGFLSPLTTSGCSAVLSILAISCFINSYKASPSFNCLRSAASVRLSINFIVVSTPKSAVSNCVSSSSNNSSSIFLPLKIDAKPEPILTRVFNRPFLRRAKKPSFFGFSAAA